VIPRSRLTRVIDQAPSFPPSSSSSLSSSSSSSPPLSVYITGDSVALHCTDSDADVVWYGMLMKPTKTATKKLKRVVRFFDVVQQAGDEPANYAGCYEFYNATALVDEEDILGKVNWVQCPTHPGKCIYHLGDDQFDMFALALDAMLDNQE
jgi:hypothetical protein